ncbi:GAF domain-containing protein [Nocardioides cavernae]|uniref:GAF domain-containing protein n=1 Tax=Nocardioides cavernae TaxID=1921566 RepID=A0A7Y9H182_9ACTN|nr:GAF domain-containing protein [Nocardioides cavernae]
MVSNDVTSEMATVEHRVVVDADRQRTLRHLVQWATQVVGPCDVAAIRVSDEDGRQSYAACHRTVPLIDELQGWLAVGPAPDTLRTSGDVVNVADVSREVRTPWTGDAAAVLDVRACLGLRLQVDGVVLGALHLYSFTPGAFDVRHVADALVLAAHASSAVAFQPGVPRADDHVGPVGGLELGQDARDVVADRLG